MECGGLSVITDAGTQEMPLWCAGSCGTSMEVRHANVASYYNTTAVLWASTALYGDCLIINIPTFMPCRNINILTNLQFSE